MRSPRISSDTLLDSEYPMPGRLVPLEGHYDQGEKCMSFAVPSQTKKQTYILWLDCRSTEIACDCIWFVDKMKTIKGLNAWGTVLEHLSYLDDCRMLPSILRKDNGMCYHCRRVKAYLVRHGILPHLKQIEGIHEQRLMNKPRKTA